MTWQPETAAAAPDRHPRRKARTPLPGAAKRVTDLDRALAERIRARRVALGLTQQQMAARIGVTYQQAHKYEIGANRISVVRLFDICRVLGLAPAELLTDLAPVAKRPQRIQRDEMALAQGVARLDGHTRKELVRFVRALARRAPPALAGAPG